MAQIACSKGSATMAKFAFPIVGVGASAGGLEAFHKFFDNMPADCGMAFIMILHLPADRKSMLADILGRWTRMPVTGGHDGDLIEPNHVYVPPPHAVVTIKDGRLGIRLSQPDDNRIPRPIDAFFDSLGSALGEQAVGLVLSGTGSDGALGLKAIKECGGLTIAQGGGGSSPQYAEMPSGAIATGSVDLIAPIEEIPGHILRIKGAIAPILDAVDDAEPTSDAARLKICEVLRAHVGHDFSGYRDKTFMRRVRRRMQVVSSLTPEDYIARLQIDHDEVVLLFRDLLIRVTSFFRDKETFATLEAEGIPQLFAGKQADGSVRVWIPGCATGEEAYSLAMLLREHMDQMSGVPKVQVFATDIDEAAIATARLGRYPETLLKGLSPERFERFFRRSQGSFVVSKEIRDLCTFSAHNLIRDPPFSRMDLVSCRNLLIYMEANLQTAVIPAFHYSLLPGGLLLLGGAESTARHEDLFEPLDKTARIYRRRAGKSPPLNRHVQSADMAMQRYVLEASGLPQATASKKLASTNEGSSVASYEHQSSSAVSAGGGLRMTFKSRAHGILKLLAPNASENERLKRELLGTQERLQSLSEQHQTALEELRSANEELHSVNEEMQSTNEELETSKEELQSVNEELHTVNGQLSEKVEELDVTNSDLRNLFESTEIATVFLDRHLIIRSFTPAISSLYNLIPSDQGRPLTDFVSRLEYTGLREDVAMVLKTLQPLERRLARLGRITHYIMRILPYHEPDNTVSGVLVTFIDVTSIVQAETALLDADLRKDVFLATLSHELRNPLAPIRTAARLLLSPELKHEELARAQAIISRQVSHMSSLLDDLLDVSRITRGAFVLKKERIDIKGLIEAAIESTQPAMETKRHTLRAEIPEVAITLEADPVRLTQVLSNLLANAAKYTADGGLITIGAGVEAQHVLIYVRDNGIGIAAETIPHIFDMFTRIESDKNRAEGGLGIGLALARGLVQLQGGHLEAHSVGLGHGSEFVVSLPRSLLVETSQEPPEEAKDASRPQNGKRVLVADDNRDGAETLGMFLKTLGHTVELAYCGAEAIDVVQRFRPNVAVLDIGMPDMTGYEVAERLRVEPWGAEVILIALTGWGQESDKRRAFDAGFDHHCTKPVDPEALERLFVTRGNAPGLSASEPVG